MAEKIAVVNVGTIGHVNHGGKTLVASLVSALEEAGFEVRDEPEDIQLHCPPKLEEIQTLEARNEKDIPEWRSSGKRKKPYHR